MSPVLLSAVLAKPITKGGEPTPSDEPSYLAQAFQELRIQDRKEATIMADPSCCSPWSQPSSVNTTQLTTI